VIERINHVSITVADIDASISFYTDLLGLRLLGRGDARGEHLDKIIGLGEIDLRWAELEVGTQMLELFQYRHPAGTAIRSRTSDSGNVHIAIEVKAIDELYQRLTAAGITCRSAPVTIPSGDWSGTRCLYALDPDGVTIELIEVAKR
jgi:glyoxylase I family protein